MRASTSRRFATILLCLAVSFSTGCTTLHPVTVDPAGERIRSEIKSGDTVRTYMLDGTTHNFRVITLGQTSLLGEADYTRAPDTAGSRVEVSYADLRQIEVRRFSDAKTAGFMVGAALVVVAIVVAAATDGGRHSPGFNR